MARRRVPVSAYDRDRDGKREHVNQYSQMREVLSETVPGFAALKRRTNAQLSFEMISLSPTGKGLGTVIDADEVKVGDVAVLNSYGMRRVIVVEEIGPRSEHDPDITYAGTLIASSDPFDQESIQAGRGVWGYKDQVSYGIRPSGSWDLMSFRTGHVRNISGGQ